MEPDYETRQTTNGSRHVTLKGPCACTCKGSFTRNVSTTATASTFFDAMHTGFPLALKTWKSGEMRKVFPVREKLGSLKILLQSQGIFGQSGKIISENKNFYMKFILKNKKKTTVVSTHIFFKIDSTLRKRLVIHEYCVALLANKPM